MTAEYEYLQSCAWITKKKKIIIITSGTEKISPCTAGKFTIGDFITYFV